MKTNTHITVQKKDIIKISTIKRLCKKQADLSAKLLTSLKAATGKAKIELVVTEFRNILHKRKGSEFGKLGVPLSKHYILHDDRKYAPGSLKPAVLMQLYVEAGSPATVEISVLGKNKKPIYYPIGVAFLPKPASPGSGPVMSFANLPPPNIYLFGTSLYVTVDPAFITNVGKYAMVYQRIEDGLIGVIDPTTPNSFL